MPSLRPAAAGDAERLRAIALAAKRQWPYPGAYLRSWERELDVGGAYIEANRVVCAELDGRVAAYSSLSRSSRPFRLDGRLIDHGLFLDQLFVDPPFQGRGLGTMLFEDAVRAMAGMGEDKLCIFVDPYARGFYEKMGARYLCDFPSAIPGGKLPVFEYRIGSRADGPGRAGGA